MQYIDCPAWEVMGRQRAYGGSCRPCRRIAKPPFGAYHLAKTGHAAMINVVSVWPRRWWAGSGLKAGL